MNDSFQTITGVSTDAEDEAREERIAELLGIIASETDHSRASRLFEMVRKEIASRSPVQIQKMERARGLV